MATTATESDPEVSILGQYIGGKWVEGSTSKEIVSTNPADSRQVLAKLKGCDEGRRGQGHRRRRGRLSRSWKATPPPVRGRILAKAAAIARERKEEAGPPDDARAGARSCPRPWARWRRASTLRSGSPARACAWAASACRRNCRRILFTLFGQPLGVVSIITPWNFPWAIPCLEDFSRHWSRAIASISQASQSLVRSPWQQDVVKIFEEGRASAGAF